MNEERNKDVPMKRVRRSKEEARAAYDRMSHWYDLMAGASERAYVEAGLRKLAVEEGEQVLEVGFGTGHALLSLARSAGSAGGVYGVDISEGMARVTRDRLRKAELFSHVVLACGDGTQLPLADRCVDGIFMSFTLELFDTPNIARALGECERLLKQGGRLCVVSLAKRGQDSLSVRLYEWVHNRFPKFVDCRPIFVETVLEEAGFDVKDVERRSMWTLPVDIVLAEKGWGL